MNQPYNLVGPIYRRKDQTILPLMVANPFIHGWIRLHISNALTHKSQGKLRDVVVICTWRTPIYCSDAFYWILLEIQCTFRSVWKILAPMSLESLLQTKSWNPPTRSTWSLWFHSLIGSNAMTALNEDIQVQFIASLEPIVTTYKLFGIRTFHG